MLLGVLLGVLLAPHAKLTDPELPTPPLPSVAIDRSPCRWPRRLLAAGLLNDAAVAYHALARRAQDSPALDRCVTHGFRRVLGVRDQRALLLKREARDMGLTPTTIERLETAVRIESRPDVLPRVVAGGIALDDGRYGVRIAMALHLAHDDPEASAVLRATLARSPLVDVPHELRGISKGGLDMAAAQTLARAGYDDAAAEEMRRALVADPTVEVPPELSAADHRLPWWNTLRGQVGPWLRTLAEVAIVAAILVAITLQVRYRLRNRMVIEAFRAREDGHGPTTASSVRENYSNILGDAGGQRMRFVESSAEDFGNLDLARDVGDAVPGGRVVAALLSLTDRVLPNLLWRVSGELQPLHPAHGAGLRLRVTRSYGRRSREETFWENRYGPWEATAGGAVATQENYDRVAVPAAAWLASVTSKKPFEALGTKSWESYALFAVGAELQERGDLLDARKRYEEALGCDDRNQGARLNRAVVDIQVSRDPRLLRRAAKSLKKLRRRLVDETQPMWYRTRYNLVVAHLRCGEGETARSVAVELCEAILRRRTSRGATRSFSDFLEQVEPTALLLLAATVWYCRRFSEKSPQAQIPALRSRLEAAMEAGTWPADAPTHAQLAGHALEVHSPLPPGGRYSLACYCVRLGDMPSATKALEVALRQGDTALGRLALDDVALEAFRADRGRRKWLEALLRELGTLRREGVVQRSRRWLGAQGDKLAG